GVRSRRLVGTPAPAGPCQRSVLPDLRRRRPPRTPLHDVWDGVVAAAARRGCKAPPTGGAASGGRQNRQPGLCVVSTNGIDGSTWTVAGAGSAGAGAAAR